MDGETLGRVLGEDAATAEVKYLGILTLDELPQKELDPRERVALIINTDPVPVDDSGEHWVAIYGDEKSPVMEYFDSFGLPPFRDEFLRFFRRQKRPWIYNPRPLQDPTSSACGYYCLHYLLLRCRGHPMKAITIPFTESGTINDDLVEDSIHEHFDIPRLKKRKRGLGRRRRRKKTLLKSQ